MWGQDGRNTYTFDKKGAILMQSVKIGDFEDKK
jgi:hypothetical protein